jgi:hypothetical protein
MEALVKQLLDASTQPFAPETKTLFLQVQYVINKQCIFTNMKNSLCIKFYLFFFFFSWLIAWKEARHLIGAFNAMDVTIHSTFQFFKLALKDAEDNSLQLFYTNICSSK